MNAMNLERVVAELQTHRGAGTVLVGIDGFGGSGKSTVAEASRSKLGDAVVVSLDDFIVKDHIDDDSWERVWDRERLRAQYDYRIWIDAPITVARMRGAARDVGNENEARWEHWSRNDLAYAATHCPRECADAIIENDDHKSR